MHRLSDSTCTQRFAYMCSSGFKCINFRKAPNFIRSTKLRLTTTTAIAYIRCYALVAGF